MSAVEGSELVAHVKQIRNMVRNLQGLPPLPDEETE